MKDLVVPAPSRGLTDVRRALGCRGRGVGEGWGWAGQGGGAYQEEVEPAGKGRGHSPNNSCKV